MITAIRQFTGGFAAGLQALVGGLANPRVRRRTIWFAVATAVLAVTMQGLGIWALLAWVHFTHDWLNYAVKIIGVVGLLFLGPFLLLQLIQILFPLLADHIFLVGVQEYRPGLYDHLRQASTASFAVTVPRSLWRIGELVVGFIVGFLLGLIPGGQLVVPVAVWLWAAWLWGIELSDPYIDRMANSHDERRRLRRSLRWSLLGYSVPVATILGLPLIGPFFYGSFQAGIPRAVAPPTPSSRISPPPSSPRSSIGDEGTGQSGAQQGNGRPTLP